MKRIATLLAAAGLLAGTSHSHATTAEPHASTRDVTTTTTTTDEDDTRGRLDIARMRHRIHRYDSGRTSITFRVTTFDPFASSRLHPRHRNFVIELQRGRDRGAQRNITISARDGRLVTEVISNATRRVIDTVDATRPNARTVRIHGPRWLIGARAYFVYSSFHAKRSRYCGRLDGYPVTCQDTVPERGWIRMDRPAWPRSQRG